MRFLLVLFVLLLCNMLAAQSDSLDALLELNAEDDGIAERLQELQLNPVNINTATSDDLSLIPYLSTEDIAHVMAYKEFYGGFSNSDSLKQLLGTKLYRQIRSFIRLGYRHKQGLSYIQKNYQGKIPNNAHYAGDPWYNYSKVIYRSGYHWAAGVIAQKDPGEQNYIDHLNGALRYRGSRLKLILGNYYLNFGQGLLFSSLYGVRKSVLPTAIFRDQSLVAHMNLSSSENSGKFGVYNEYSLGASYRFFGFFSENSYDARLSGLDVRALRSDGYHRTATEISGADRIKERVAAAGLVSHWKKLRVGIILGRYTYKPGFNLQEDEQDLRKSYFDFRGDQLNVGSMMYTYLHGPYHFSGEAAFSGNGKPGFQQSLFYHSGEVRAGIKFWHINPGFQSPDGRMFDNSAPFPSANQGYIASLQLRPYVHWRFAAYKIFRQNLWRNYFNRMPVQKNEWLAEISFQQKQARLTLRYRRRDGDSFSQLNQLDFDRQDNIRLEIAYRTKGGPWLKSRLEKTFFLSSSENGFIFFQDMGYRFGKHLQLMGRMAFYKSSSFESGIYEFENDLPGSFSNYSLYGEGHLIYLMVIAKAWDSLRFYLKWRMNKHSDFKTNGRSDNNIESTLRSGLVLQF